MGTNASEGERERLRLRIDDRGRVTIPKDVRDRLGIEPNDTVPATLIGSVLEVTPEPSNALTTATAGRDDWAGSTPTDAGRSLFGPMDRESPARTDDGEPTDGGSGGDDPSGA